MELEPPLVRSSSRLEAYSDALFSIIATVMIVPISHTELSNDESLSHSFITKLLPQILIYIYTFLTISSYWTLHTWLFEILENVDEFMVLFNLALMMVVTFLPFTFTLLGLYVLDPLAIVIFSGAIILISLIKIVFIIHAFRTPGMLKMEFRDVNIRTSQRNRMLVQVGTPLIFAVVALIAAYLSPTFALVSLVLMIFAAHIRAAVAKCYASMRSQNAPEMPEYVRIVTPLRKRLMTESITKERIEFFSDGVFAIVATLIILDICEENIPTEQEVQQHGSLAAALYEFTPMYVAYAGTFSTVALQWYVHHSLLHYMKEFNKLMVWLNQLCLLCIGLSPLAFKLTSNYDRHKFGENENVAIQFNCIVIFLASMFQATIWIAALFSQQRHLHPDGRHKGDDHGYMSAKLAIFPLLSITVYWMACFMDNISVNVFVAMEFSAIGLFILIGLLFAQIRRIYTGRQERLLVDGDEGASTAQQEAEVEVHDPD